MINATTPQAQLQQFAAELCHTYPADSPIPSAPAWWLCTLPAATTTLCLALSSIHTDAGKRRSIALGSAYAAIAAIATATSYDLAFLYQQGLAQERDDLLRIRSDVAKTCRKMAVDGFNHQRAEAFHFHVAEALGSIDRLRSAHRLPLIEVLQAALDR